ncbi:TadE/TadG family type IV pilus assembly protein [Pontixanthobacter gangjinensis]|uniref:TadE-like domain-containing protein n=1 Tax=Pontixanthobacter gangjinensis TaxID=1028742 RepID=A0A6I4SKC1_9SPHN|nr:TadE family protein [Pontixanthobacter gangjinensis]MXO55262.1 hypothetical protein [Pontixanthobacter gangjinensis]
MNRKGTASIEFVLALPIMFALMFGGMEAGHFFWTQHKLVKAVRDGARFATRIEVEDLCNGGTAVMSAALEDEIQNVTATGQIAAGGLPKVPGWSPNDVDVTIGCQAFVDTGIYSDLGAAGPMVSISSGMVTYPSILAALGFLDSNYRLSAQSSAAVMGI